VLDGRHRAAEHDRQTGSGARDQGAVAALDQKVGGAVVVELVVRECQRGGVGEIRAAQPGSEQGRGLPRPGVVVGQHLGQRGVFAALHRIGQRGERTAPRGAERGLLGGAGTRARHEDVSMARVAHARDSEVRRDRGPGIAVRLVNPGRAVIERHALQGREVGIGAAAHPRAGLEHHDTAAGLDQHPGRCQAGGAGADDRDVRIRLGFRHGTFPSWRLPVRPGPGRVNRRRKRQKGACGAIGPRLHSFSRAGRCLRTPTVRTPWLCKPVYGGRYASLLDIVGWVKGRDMRAAVPIMDRWLAYLTELAIASFGACGGTRNDRPACARSDGARFVREPEFARPLACGETRG
jgi:hypothetical protein